MTCIPGTFHAHYWTMHYVPTMECSDSRLSLAQISVVFTLLRHGNRSESPHTTSLWKMVLAHLNSKEGKSLDGTKRGRFDDSWEHIIEMLLDQNADPAAICVEPVNSSTIRDGLTGINDGCSVHETFLRVFEEPSRTKIIRILELARERVRNSRKRNATGKISDLCFMVQ